MSGIQQVVFFTAYSLVWVAVVSIVLVVGPGWKHRALISLGLAVAAVLLIVNGALFIASALPLLLLLGANWKRRAAYGLPVWLLFALYPAYWFGMEQYYQYLAKRDYAVFQDLCKQAEETIYRRVETVEGVMRMRLHAPYTPVSERAKRDGSFADQFGLENPYGKVMLDPHSGPRGFLHSMEESEYPPTYEFLEEVTERGAPPKPPLRRYWSVETEVLVGTKYPRSSRAKDKFRRIETAIVNERKAKYGYTWKDLTTLDLRKRWIAGAEYTILDLDTGEILAKKVGYIFARMYPSGHLNRATWGLGQIQKCANDRRPVLQFISDVLVPTSRSKKEQLTSRNRNG